jgi:lipoyl(octanoyl) transferase
VIKHLGLVEYEATWRAMQDFTAARTSTTADQIWLLQHPPVFTLGMAGKREHLLADIGVPVVAIDRGGQVTYHGPGQIVVYLLLDLKRLGYGIKELVRRMEQALIDVLAESGIVAERQTGAPGVYVAGAKIAALGLRVKNGCTYHGLSLNVDMDLSPFQAINPCGYAGMAVTQMRDLTALIPSALIPSALISTDRIPNAPISSDTVAANLLTHLLRRIGPCEV